ncbi:hypothetical protein BH24ACT2_BH24ACT2_18000 [soil metagenome]
MNDPLQYAAEDEETSGVSDDAVVHRDPPPPTRRASLRHSHRRRPWNTGAVKVRHHRYDTVDPPDALPAVHQARRHLLRRVHGPRHRPGRRTGGGGRRLRAGHRRPPRLPPDQIDAKLPDIADFVRTYQGLEPKTDLIPIQPTVYYAMGDIPTNVDAEVVIDADGTTVPGLYAAWCRARYKERAGAGRRRDGDGDSVAVTLVEAGYLDCRRWCRCHGDQRGRPPPPVIARSATSASTVRWTSGPDLSSSQQSDTPRRSPRSDRAPGLPSVVATDRARG